MKKFTLACLLVLLFVLLAGCGSAPAAQTPTPTEPLLPLETAQPTQSGYPVVTGEPTLPGYPSMILPLQPAYEEPPTTTPGHPAGGLFEIIRPDGTSLIVTSEDLLALPNVQVKIEGKVQEGPKVTDLLTFAGITDYSEVTFYGSNASVTLTRAQVEADTLLDFANSGTVKLATTAIPKAQWTKDITRIEVK